MTKILSKGISIEEISIFCEKIIREVSKAFVGKTDTHKLIMTAFLCQGGHILLEDFPGFGKTLLASSFSQVLGMDYKRIQFTPDLLPEDITGGYVFDNNKRKFAIRKGPVFTNILLADEIDRASSKTQSALLEAMQEHQVTLEGETMSLPDPFIVFATQNPVEDEGSFSLPEAQLDRFIVKLSLEYPNPYEENEILRKRTERKKVDIILEKVINPDILTAMRMAVEDVFIDPDIMNYIIKLVNKSRKNSNVVVGASSRRSLALLKLSRAWAAVHNRNYVTPDDVKQFCQPALAHRIILEPGLWDVPGTDRKIVMEIGMGMSVPVFKR